ncbi:MAG: hypothetical protein HOP19_05045 [Acidobacteria bacterium]|nr:hypothetical protein [Acidobacteriota bacterium]
MKRIAAFVLCVLCAALSARADERDANAISQNIQTRHQLNGLIVDPVFASPTSEEIVGYSRAGDAAIWTGHYLAAESFRYQATRSPEALANIKRSLAGIRLLLDVTGNDLLARFAMPASWKYASSVTEEERRHCVYSRTLNGETWLWFGNTSRDQYSGVFFGLGTAYDFVDDPQVRTEVRALVTRLLDYLIDNNWSVRMPNGDISTTFAGRPEQRLNFLAIGRHANDKFASSYNLARIFASATVGSAIVVEVLEEHDSYFKFNLATINFFHLIRTEGNKTYRGRYLNAYQILRRTTDDHGNAHFNMIDRVLRGADARRDAETKTILNDWLKRPRRDGWRDHRGDARFPACGEDRACNPIPVTERIDTDFLWQRSPFLLWGGGYGKTENAGIDYLLPYWMARAFGVAVD